MISWSSLVPIGLGSEKGPGFDLLNTGAPHVQEQRKILDGSLGFAAGVRIISQYLIVVTCT